MRVLTQFAVLTGLLATYTTVSAQVPHIVGTWKLNAAASEYPGPKPQSDIRRYFLNDQGYLIGLAVTISADGQPSFLQFAGKTDGKDYAEHAPFTLAQLQISGTPSPLAYSEQPKDEYTIQWTDKFEGNVTASGTRAVSKDGKVMTVVAKAIDPQGKEVSFTLIYDRQ